MEILEATKIRLLILLAGCRQEEEALRELLSTKDFDLKVVTINIYAALGMITEVECLIRSNTFTKEEIELHINEALPPIALYIANIEQLMMLNNMITRETVTDESQSKIQN